MGNFEEDDKQDEGDNKATSNSEGPKAGGSWISKRLKIVSQFFSLVFYSFPSSKPNLQEYYLAKVTSMYSENFVTSVVVLISFRVFASLMTIRSQSRDVASLLFWITEIIIVMGLCVLADKSLIVRKPTLAKTIMI